MPSVRKERARWAAAAAHTPAGRPRRRDLAFAISLSGVLAAYNNLPARHAWQLAWYPAANLGATGAVLAAAAAAGLTAGDVGLGRDRLAAGLRAGAGPAAGLAAGWALLAALPATRPALTDQRVTGLTWRQAGYQAGVRIPVGTVLWEETAFRGVLLAAWRRVLPGPAAAAVTCGLFGLWHIRPTVGALRVNRLAAGDRAEAAGVAAAVAGTAAAGLLLGWLRDRSGSLAAPVLLHLAANSGGALAARAAVAGTGGWR